MGRLLGRLRNKRGSVLFLVVMVMSLLIIAASATIYIVNNQQSATVIRYNSEQSYQSAVSVNNTISSYIDGYLKHITSNNNGDISGYENTIVGKMMTMGIGESSSITSEVDLSKMGMGITNVTIKKVDEMQEGEKKSHIYEISAEATVNGETVKVTQVKKILTGPTEYFTRFLTSTGNRGEDVTFGSYMILSEVYFENEFSVIGASAATRMTDSLYSSGTLLVGGIQYGVKKDSEPYETAVAKNLLLSNSGQNFMSKGGNVYVGENFETLDDKAGGDSGVIIGLDGAEPLNIYVLGDCTLHSGILSNNVNLYVNGNCYIKCATESNRPNATDIRGKIYVNKDLYIENGSESNNFNTSSSELHVKGNVYLSGTGSMGANVFEFGGTLTADSTWGNLDGRTNTEGMSDPFSEEEVGKVSAYISTSTSKNDYQTWDAEGYFEKLEKEAEENGTPMPEVHPGPLSPSASEWSKWSDETECIINQNCILYPSEGWAGGWTAVNIIIDATEQDIYIKLQPLSGSNVFSFVDKASDGTYFSTLNILIKGSHSVIFVLPHDVDFVMPANTYIGHIGMASKITGKTEEDLLVNKMCIFSNSFGYGKRGDVSAASGAPESGAVKEVDSWFKKSVGVPKVPDGSMIIDSTILTDPNVHNNIFIVTKGSQNQIDFSNDSAFCGYIYAPNAILRSNSTAGSKLAFVGGMIVGSYTYTDLNAALMFTMPCDYADNYKLDKKTDIVKKLIQIAQSDSTETPSSGGSSSTAIQGYETIGYK